MSSPGETSKHDRVLINQLVAKPISKVLAANGLSIGTNDGAAKVAKH